MADALPLDFEANQDRLFIHFDVKDHHIALDTFVATAQSAQQVLQAIDDTFFNGELSCEVIVVPPSDGSFLSMLKWTGVGVSAVFAFLNTEVGAAYIKGLTGRLPSEWARELGEDHNDTIQQLREALPSNDTSTQELETSSTEVSDHEQAVCRLSIKILTAMTQGILEKDIDELDAVGMETGNLPDALDARADFYKACIENSEVLNIGFTPEEHFPIPRSSFPQRAIRRERKKPEDNPAPWVVNIESIFVTSPNWDQDDQKSRKWKGKDQTRRDCYFTIDDAEFWHHVQHKDLRVEVLDNLKVQWAYQDIEGHPKNRRVLRVLEFNGDQLASPLSKSAIDAILGQHADGVAPSIQPTLFDG